MQLLNLPPYIQGALYSFVFLLAIGPSFFYLLSLSILKGFRSGALFALGMVTSDIAIMTIIYYGFGDLFETNIFKLFFNGIGGCILLFIGIKFILDKEIKKEDKQTIVVKSGIVANFFKGFFVNLGNPFAYLAWLTVRSTIAHTHPEFNSSDYLMFFCGLFGMITLLELCKAFLAHKIGKFLTDRVLFLIHKLLGFIFGSVGIWLVYLMYQEILKYLQ